MNPSTITKEPRLRAKPPELLAPAKDLICGITAINCGADAVYTGAARFSARKDAGNSTADIAALAKHAHLYGAKVYVALNTVLFDADLEPARKLINEVYDAGADGLIIQDTGLLELDLPPVPLIASTQMHNTTVEQVQFLSATGFQRAILARELPLSAIARIRQNCPDIELECFVHGALCVSTSGRCYLSLARGGRSGNRGECAQPCRKRYTLHDGDGQLRLEGHLLSIRDLDRTSALGAMIDAGVNSFKIEGRLKDRIWLANVVTHYRRAIDAAIADRASDQFEDRPHHVFEIPFTPDLKKTFSRGATDFGLFGATRMGTPDSPTSEGELLGIVTQIRNGQIEIDTEATLHPGDGLRWVDRDGTASGTRVQKIEGPSIHVLDTRNLKTGQIVFRNVDRQFRDAVEKAELRRRIPITVRASIQNGLLAIEAFTADGICGIARSATVLEPAQQPDKAGQTFYRQLSKTGDSPFICGAVELELATPPFIPVSTLNELRRTALSNLEERLRAAHVHPLRPLVRNSFPYPISRLNFEANVTNSLARTFYLRHGVTEIAPGAEIAGLPEDARLMTSIYCIRRELDACLLTPEGKTLKGPLTLRDDHGAILALRFDCQACQMEVYLQPTSAQKPR